MTNRKTPPSPLLVWAGRLAVVFLAFLSAGPVHADPPEARARKSVGHAKNSRAVKLQGGKATGAKAKPAGTGKAEKSDHEAAAASPEAKDKARVAPSPGTERVDFEGDADHQKMEPSLELIQAAPRRARHRSLVPAEPRPEDSVVNHE